MQMRDEARANVAHDAFAHERIQIALIDPDDRRHESRDDHRRHVEPQRVHVVPPERDVDEMFREERGREAERGDDDDAREHGDVFAPIGTDERSEARPMNRTLNVRFIGTVHARPHQVGRRAA